MQIAISAVFGRRCHSGGRDWSAFVAVIYTFEFDRHAFTFAFALETAHYPWAI